jgi:hypothetical protein
MMVSDRLTALLPGAAFIAMTRALTAPFGTGEFAFNAYAPRAGHRGPRVRRRPVAGGASPTRASRRTGAWG